MKSIFNIITREIKFIFSSKLYIFLLFVFPVADCLFLSGIYISGTLTKLPIAVIDEDNSKMSRTIIRYFDASSDMEVKYRLSNIPQLQDLLIKQKAVLGLYIPKGLQNNIKKQVPQNLIIFTNASNFVAANIADTDASTIIATIEAGIKYQVLAKKGFSQQQALELVQMIRNDNMKLFNPALNYNVYLTPGLWLSVLHQLLILFGTLSLAKEFELKTIRKMYETANKSVLNVLTGKIILYMGIAFIHFEILYRFLFPFFGIEFYHWDTPTMAISVSLFLAALSLGFLLSAALRNCSNALKGCLLISAPAFLLSGYTFPIETMPRPLQLFVQIIPLTPFLEGFKKIYQQNLGINYIYPYIFHLLILAFVFFVFAYICLNISVKKEMQKQINENENSAQDLDEAEETNEND
ncbi:MAG: ABC transporter permease [Elusimicrobiota bacterium]|jgi:ABC-2 type transport system permease protein|nr:ABC transporter permease [Elusimicrobiota bacterium]